MLLYNNNNYWVNLPRAALMPPWAATVCDLVGNSLVIRAVLNPFCTRPKAARRPEPPAPTTTASNSWSITLYALEMAPVLIEASFLPVEWTFLLALSGLAYKLNSKISSNDTWCIRMDHNGTFEVTCVNLLSKCGRMIEGLY